MFPHCFGWSVGWQEGQWGHSTCENLPYSKYFCFGELAQTRLVRKKKASYGCCFCCLCVCMCVLAYTCVLAHSLRTDHLVDVPSLGWIKKGLSQCVIFHGLGLWFWVPFSALSVRWVTRRASGVSKPAPLFLEMLFTNKWRQTTDRAC